MNDTFDDINEEDEDDEESMEDNPSRVTLVALLSCVFTANLLYLNSVSLLPQYVADYYPQLNSLSVGILFSSYQIAFIIVAPFIGNHLASFGRRRALFAAIILYTIATTVFGSAGWIFNVYAFYGISFVARCFQGMADAVILIVTPSIISMEYPVS